MRLRVRARVGAYVAATLLVGAMVATLAPGSAQAELSHPRQDWLRGSTAGLFLHWGMRTSPGYQSCSDWENAVTNGGWTPTYWINEAKKLHAQYVVLASFHSRLGYARAWPSSVPGSCSTKRDFLGELIKAGEAGGVKVILYMTDDPQWHTEGRTSGSWLNSAAYSSWKGRSVNISTRDGFGEFSQDNFLEVMRKYPTLSGFWIDNDNAYWERNGLYQRIRTERPNYVLSNNNEDTPIMDTISNEQKSGMSPSYDYPQAVYTAQPRLTEACFTIAGRWWYTGSNPTVDRTLTLGRYVTNAGSSVKSLIAEGAMVNGRFPSNQEAFNNFANGYFGPIWEAFRNTEGGGYMYGGLKPGFWNDGAHGVTTISRTNANLHYIHVIKPPSTSTLRLRDNGYRVTKVTNLRSGAAVSYSQSGGNLTLTGLGGWDAHDTVFKVETNGRAGIIPASSYTMSATASASGNPASNAADGNYLTYWDSNKTTPVSLRFDLGSAKRVQYLGINQREDSVSYSRSGTEQSARIRDYRVYFSSDGSNWGSPVKTGALPSHRGVAIIDLPATTTRHVRLEVVNTHAASSDGNRYKRLRVDEAWIGSDYASAGTPAPDPAGRHEAENATISAGVVESNHTGFSGTGFVNYTNAAGSYLEWTVNAEKAGQATLTFAYANGTAIDRPMAIAVNGAVVTPSLSFPSTDAWTTWQTATVTVNLKTGANTVRATANTAEGGPNTDYLEVQ
jgi:alpha-L-fucosidase